MSPTNEDNREQNQEVADVEGSDREQEAVCDEVTKSFEHRETPIRETVQETCVCEQPDSPYTPSAFAGRKSPTDREGF